MPLGGLIPDSPWIYAAQKAGKWAKKSSRGINLAPRVSFSYRVSNVKLYTSVLNFELYQRAGMTASFLHKRVALPINAAAKSQVGVKTGLLRQSIGISHFIGPAGAAVKIGSSLHYAYLHHEGSRPHIIKPKEPGGALVFTKGSRVIRSRMVMHPGTRPNRYLSDQLRIYIPR
jgi:hypothetical protein